MTNEEYYRYTEKVLYSYKNNVNVSEKLIGELDMLRNAGDISGQSYGNSGKVSGILDPVLAYVMRVEGLESKLKRVMRRVKAVDTLREDLRNGNVITVTSARDLLKILNEHYIEKQTVSAFLGIHNWVRSTFYARKHELVLIAGEYLRV